MTKKTDIFADEWGSKEELIKRMKEKTNVLENPRIEAAFEEVDRKDFLKPGYKVEAYEDYAIPIGGDQTNSQPTTVAYMLELLAPKEGDVVLDVGSGSGWTTGLLAHIVGRHGRVIGMEVQEELAEFGRKNLSAYDFPQAEIRHGNPLKENLDEGPFSRILVSAATNSIPETLTSQLSVGGIMVIPIDESLVQVTKKANNELVTQEFDGFKFVPLVT